ncbi:pyridoxal-phosphate dependent enzyme [Kitasatospora acidiphila]|uniref:Pyridoxal-phosphate dependent enzyme n=1 Tax=Kitasatospora acidiphila TaxID=2567942 RepID=A0A540WG66_9ACTN|nr:pyridoxal-phosphate dependent enzyme [Kitasatospora acidiphila]TQF08011.1 pyridoxal-phosphate dependent enzyme [Kitasatospora acidiphila]
MTDQSINQLACPSCPDRVPADEEILQYRCGGCGEALRLQLPAPRPFVELVAAERGLPWRYPELVPVQYEPELDDHVLPRVVRSPQLESRLGVAEVWLVDGTALGTGTFKDFEAAIVLAAAKQHGLRRVSVHSTGNTALAYRHYAQRAGVSCAGYLPRLNVDKLGDITADPEQPLYAIDCAYAELSAKAKAAAAADGRVHLAPFDWKLEGKSVLASVIYEAAPQVDTIVQTVAGGYGPLGFEVGFERLSQVVDTPAGVLCDRRYRLYQPGDADTLTWAWQHGIDRIEDSELRLPEDPFEPTLQSTNPVATLPQLRAGLPVGSTLESVPPKTVEDLRPVVDEILAEAGIALDYQREKSGYISLTGLLKSEFDPAARLAVVVSGSRAFAAPAGPGSWHLAGN